MTLARADDFDQAAFQAAFAAPLSAWRGRRVCVGLSGGLDSVVLLHLVCTLRERLGIAAVSALHVHHGLQPQADGWADFCAGLCRRWQADYACERVSVSPQGLGVEAAARQARYGAFARQNADIIALAHHADDQAETFLLAALRGGGLRALAAMPEVRPLRDDPPLELWRPLLPFTRARLAAYAAANALRWVEDPSNGDTALLRNRLRHRILPELSAAVPNAPAHIRAAVALLQDEQALLDEITDADWAEVCGGGGFERGRWQRFSPPRRRQLLRRFALCHGLGTPRRAVLLNWEEELCGSAATGQWRLPHGRALLYRNRLFPLPDGFEKQFGWLDDTPFSGSLNDAARQSGIIWQRGERGLPEAVLQQPGRIRAARADDTLPIAGGRKAVGKLLQEHGVPPFMRLLWPVAADAQDNCIAVANIRSAHPGTPRGYLPVSALLAPFQAA